MAEFKTIGKKFGHFDLTMIKIGAYNETWPDIHLNPEQVIDAHINLNGKHLLPIHWGTFNLSLHSWYEPVERLTKEANIKNVKLLTPKIGEIIPLNDLQEIKKWWETFK